MTMRTESFPDTLFLPDRARLAINCLTRCLNPAKNDLPYCVIDLTCQPPRMRHSQFDFSDHTSRVIDALLLAQAMTGSADGNAQIERLEEIFWRGFGADGLHYTPDNPWSFRHANMHYQRSVLNGLLALTLARRSERAAEQARALAKGLAEIAVKREGFWYFPSVERLPDGWPRGDWGILGFGVDPANTNGRLLFGLTRLHEALRDPNARDLAQGFAAHVMDHSSAYLPDGGFAAGMEFREGHFHSRAVTLLGVVRYGHGFGDARALAWGKRTYDRAKRYGTSFGWFPERLVESRAHGCETCAVVDMMETAIWLAKSGYAECWEDAERFLRNHLVESQLTDVSWAEACADERGADEWETTSNVARRALGGFAGWSQPNDLVSSKVMHGWDLYMCCCAQGVRGLFNAWTNAVTAGSGEVRVNLLINHLGEHATVRSWLPHEGRIEVALRREAEVVLRVPSWVDRRSLTLTADGQDVAFGGAEAHFVRTRPLPAGAVLEARFPLREAATRETVLGVDYAVDWRGDAVLGISPSGARAPLYGRAALAQGAPAMSEKAAPIVDFAL
jgi:hypothetical protein